METRDQNWEDKNQTKKTDKHQSVNEPKQHTNVETEKKGTYVKDMPPIDGARPGVI